MDQMDAEMERALQVFQTARWRLRQEEIALHGTRRVERTAARRYRDAHAEVRRLEALAAAEVAQG
jgi:hypothetical protein